MNEDKVKNAVFYILERAKNREISNKIYDSQYIDLMNVR
jgi:hypothetical protein